MIIGIDGNLLCGKKTGMGVVAHNILKHLKIIQGNRVILYVPGELDEAYKGYLISNGIEVKCFGHCSYPIWEQIVLLKMIKKDSVDVLWCPYNTAPIFTRVQTIITVHDVIYMDQRLRDAPNLYKKFGMLYRKLIVPKAVKKAKKVITDSQYAKNEILRYFPEAENKIEVIYCGADIYKLSNFDEKQYLELNDIRIPYILGFGSLEKRKNSMGLIKAYEGLEYDIRQSYQLVLFGFRGFKESEEYIYIQEHKLDNVKVLGYVSEDEKCTLYKNSAMFVFPTLSEGFGIPVLEAYAAGTPVITSNTTSLPEVAGDAAVLIDPEKTSQLSKAISRLIIDKDQRITMVKRGLEQLKKFDWSITSSKVINAIEEAADL